MTSIIIYATDDKYLNKTIDGIIDKTANLREIIVCNDAQLTYNRSGVKIVSTNKIGRAKAWNNAANIAIGDDLIFIKDKTKVSDGWTNSIINVLDNKYNCIASPVVHTLDLGLWSTESSRWRRFGWRWDLNLYDRHFVNRNESPSVSSYCIAITKKWFDEIGGFDNGMDIGSGEDIEISVRSWLFGGSVEMVDDSIIAVALEIDCSSTTINNFARIIEAWFPTYSSHFYNSRNLQSNQVNVGRLDNLLKLQSKLKKSPEWFLNTKQPELFSMYGLAGSAAGKSIAIVGTGPSLDLINPALINRHDIIISIDYIGMLFDCDFVMADTVHVVTELKKKYADNKFIVPIALQDQASGSYVAAAEVVPAAQQFEMVPNNTITSSTDLPLCNLDNLILTAVHFALFLKPSSVYVFGCDNKIINGKSHTSKIEYYDDGKLFADNEATKRQFALCEFGLDQLGKIA